MDKNKIMQISYDKDADVLYLSIGEPRPAISREIGDDVLLRIDPESGEVIGMTVLNLSMRKDFDVTAVELELRESA